MDSYWFGGCLLWEKFIVGFCGVIFMLLCIGDVCFIDERLNKCLILGFLMKDCRNVCKCVWNYDKKEFCIRE